MNKYLKILLWVTGILLLVAFIMFIVKKVKQNKANKEAVKSTVGTVAGQTAAGKHTGVNIKPPTSIGAVYTTLPDGSFPLKKGSKNKLVYLYQHYLNVLFGHNLTLDGNWGTLTQNASVVSTGFHEITKDVAKQLLEKVPTELVSHFEEYADLIKAKITK